MSKRGEPVSRVPRGWEDYAKAVMHEQDPEKLTHFIRQLNLALDADERLAFPAIHWESERAAQIGFKEQDGLTPQDVRRLDTGIAALPGREGRDETGELLEPRRIASLPHAGDRVLSREESITCHVAWLRTEVG